MEAGFRRGDHGGNEDICIEHHSHLFACVPFGPVLGSDLADGLIDDALDFIRVGVGIILPNVLNGALKHAPANCVLNELREITLFHPLGAQERAQDQIGNLLRIRTGLPAAPPPPYPSTRGSSTPPNYSHLTQSLFCPIPFDIVPCIAP